MKHYICLAFLLAAISINAQSNLSTRVSEADTMFLPKLTGEIYIQIQEHKGDLFFNKDYVKGNILLSTGTMVYGQYLKYYGYLDELVWYNASSYKQFILDKSNISEFWLKDSLSNPVHFKRINVRDSTASHQPDIFAEVAVEGKISLYIQRKISFLYDEETYRDKKAFFIKVFGPTPLYYIKLTSNYFIKIARLNRRTFLNLFPEQKKSLSKLIKGNNIDLESEKGWIEMIQSMNK